MKLTITAFLAALLCASPSLWGQIPTATYDPATGRMDINSEAFDIVAVLIGGPDVSVSGCSLCNVGPNNLPGEATNFADASSWTVGFINSSTQWIRTNPLSGLGFRGEIGEFWIDGTGTTQPWPDDIPPFLDFPEAGQGIAIYPTGLTEADFPKVFSDGSGEADFNVRFGTDASGDFFANVIVLPEPNAMGLLGLMSLALLGVVLRRS